MSKLVEKYKSLSIQVKASLWFILSNLLQKGIALITIPVFTRIMTSEQFGIVNVFNSWSSLLTIFLTLNLSYGVFNKGLVKYENSRDSFTSSIQGLTITISMSLCVFYFIFQGIINKYTGLSTLLMVVMFVEILFSAALGFWSARQRFEYKYRNLIIVTLLMTVFNAIMGIVAVQFAEVYKAEARLISSALVVFIIGGIIFGLGFLKGKQFYNKDIWKFALAFNIPLIPHYLSQSVLNQSDRILINEFVGSTEAGIYGVAYSAGMLLTIFNSALIGSITPWMYESIKKKEYEGIAQKINGVLFVMFLLIIILILLAPEAIQILAPSEYYDAIYVIPPVAASVFFMFLYNVVCLIEFYFEKTKLVMIASILGAVLNIILNVYLIPKYGYLIAGYTTLMSYIFMTFLHYVFAERIQKSNGILPRLVGKNIPINLSLIVILISIVINFFYDESLIRYGVLLLILVSTLCKHKQIKSHLLEFKKI